MKTMKLCLILLLAVITAEAWAGNRMLLADFDGSEDTMAISVATTDRCPEPPASLPYKELGVLTVGASGEYQVADLSPVSVGLSPPGSIETVLLIYDGSFDSQNPSMNRVAVFDYGELNFVNEDNFVQLDSGTNYPIVIQNSCSADPGLAGFVIRGPGGMSGVGKPTPADYYGDFSAVDTIADFPDWGTKYYESFKYTPPKTGNYWFWDMGYAWGGSYADQRIYLGSFDPENPMDNLIAAVGYYGFSVYLEAGKEIEVVNVDMFDESAIYQMVIYPPGELQGFNPAITGAFADLAVKNQGIMIETDEVFEAVFFTWFTFDDDPGAAPTNTAVGSSDQRWLSAYGGFSYDSTEVALSFENSTGGQFNMTEPKPEQDQSYGTGSIIAHDCDTLEINYDLPGTSAGSMTLKRLFPGKGRICADWVWVGSPVN